MRYEGAIFDQDGLLFDTEIIYQQSWRKAGLLQGVEVDPAYIRTFCGVAPDRIEAMVRQDWPALDAVKFRQDAAQLAWEAQLSGVPPEKKGLREMLGFCRANGIRTAVASSSIRRVVVHNLEAAGVIGFFDAIVTGDEVTNGKPAPDIFLLAASRLGLDPKRCCVFEDAFSGIRGAAAAGCGAVLIPDQNQPTDEIRRLCRVHPDLETAIAVFNG